jgi:glucokinase
MSMKHYIGVDIGGTNIACGLVDKTGKIIHKDSIKTQPELGFESAVQRIAELVKTIGNADLGVPQLSIGIGCPGVCNKDTGVVEVSNNLNWHNVPLKAEIERLTGLPVNIDNDANAAAYGEFIAGAAKGANSAVAITLGTGVGGGVIIDGKILSGMNHAGGEIGHMVINADGLPCNCGRVGCFEVYSSATGLIHSTKEVMEFLPDSKMHEIAEKMGKISARTAWLAASDGDEGGITVVESYIHYLSVGIANVINIFQPDILCIGGGVCNEKDNLLVPLKKQVAEQIFSRNSAKNTEIKICELGNDAGIIGAALMP